jgi:hypothetical protein
MENKEDFSPRIQQKNLNFPTSVMGNNLIITRLFLFFKLCSPFHHFKYITPLSSPYNISFALQELRVFQSPSNTTLRFQGASKAM